MGASFANLQLASENVAAIADAIRLAMSELGFEESPNAGVATIAIPREVVIRAPSHGWTPVYDQGIEHDPAELDALGRAVSRALNRPAVTILVDDSDALELALYGNGQALDLIQTWPGHLEGADRPTTVPVRLSRWRDVLRPGVTAEQFADALRPVSPWRAEQSIEHLGPILGWDPDAASMGYRSLGPGVDARDTVLRFRRRDLERSGPGRPPAFGNAGGDGPSVEATVGRAFSFVAIAHSKAGESHGLSVAVFGPAIERGLVDVARIRLAIGNPMAGRGLDGVLSRDVASGVVTAVFESTPIPPGMEGPAAAFATATDGDAGLEAWLATRFEAGIELVARAAGTERVDVGFVPLANVDEGQTSWSLSLRISNPR